MQCSICLAAVYSSSRSAWFGAVRTDRKNANAEVWVSSLSCGTGAQAGGNVAEHLLRIWRDSEKTWRRKRALLRHVLRWRSGPFPVHVYPTWKPPLFTSRETGASIARLANSARWEPESWDGQKKEHGCDDRAKFFDNIAPVLAMRDEAYLLSPILFDLTGFHPMDIFYGTDEVLIAYFQDIESVCKKYGSHSMFISAKGWCIAGAMEFCRRPRRWRKNILRR